MTDFVPYLRPEPAPDASFWRENYERNSWDAPLFAPTDLVIDLGAGVGAFTRRAWENGSRNVLAFEMDPEYLKVAKRNLRDCEGVSLFDDAVVAEGSPPTMPYVVGSCSLWSGNTTGFTVSVATCGLDAIVGGRDVRFLKMNVEGAEWGILYTTHVLPHVQEIAMQLHEQGECAPLLEQDPALPPFKREALAAFLEEDGFSVELRGPYHNGTVCGLRAWR